MPDLGLLKRVEVWRNASRQKFVAPLELWVPAVARGSGALSHDGYVALQIQKQNIGLCLVENPHGSSAGAPRMIIVNVQALVSERHPQEQNLHPQNLNEYVGTPRAAHLFQTLGGVESITYK